MEYDIVIIGGGPAGLAAAIEAKKNGVDSILVLERDRELGGILQQCIHNGFGLHVFKEELTGPEYAQRFIDELNGMQIKYLPGTTVLHIAGDKVVHAVNGTQGYLMIQAKAIVLAMGCRERTAGAIAIPGTRPAGILTAGTAQRYVNMEGYRVGERVVILGSGDIGLIMARRMTLEGAKVMAVAEVLPFSGGLTRNIVQCLEDFDIPLFLSHTVIEVRGKNRVEAVVIAQVDAERKPIPGTEMTYECDTLLLSVGLIPENEVSKTAGVRIDERTGGPIVDESMESSVEGIFACGNVVHVHDLVDFVTQESRRAGMAAARYVLNNGHRAGETLEVLAKNGISYTVPQRININNEEGQLDVFFRVRKIYIQAKILVHSDGHMVREVLKKHLAPGEMAHLTLDRAELKNLGGRTLTIEVEEVHHG